MPISSAVPTANDASLDAELVAAGLDPGSFHEPDFRAPLDVAGMIAEVPAQNTTKGMFFEQLARAARQFGLDGDARYVAFRDYPLRDFMRLIADYGSVRFPGLPVREALRRVGWEAFPTLMSSVAGRVLFAFAGHEVRSALRLAPDAYKHSLSHCSVRSRLNGARQAVLEYRDVWNFPDCYQVGAIEGGCRAFGATPTVRVCAHGRASVDMLIRW
jgi:uncharacterized protein (TIGR02265 family)